jgi:hypothetical protein
MSRKLSRRKCRCCRIFFRPDYRNAPVQQYCPAPACRQASKLASQRRWRRTASGRDYFRGEQEVRRVQEWRQQHPGYWKKQKSRSEEVQAPDPQLVNREQTSRNVPTSDLRTLQDFCLTQDPAFVGLISLVTGSTLQDDIAATARKLLLRGQNILGLKTSGQTSPTTLSTTHEKAPAAA